MRSLLLLSGLHCRVVALLVACSSLVAPSASAEPEHPTSVAPKTMTLAEALAYAHAHQPAIRAGVARVAARREEARIPEGQWRPTIAVTGQLYGATANNTTGTYVNPTSMDVPRIGATRSTTPGSFRPYPSTLAGVGVTQELFEFGRIAAQRAAGDALVDAERHSAEAARLDIDFGVEESFFAVFAAKAVVTTAEQAFERARAHRDLAKAGVDGGLRSPIELTRADADLARFDIGRSRAHGGLVIAQSVLAAAIGSQDATVDVGGESPKLADMPALAEAIQRASARDPYLLQALSLLKAQEARTRAIGAELRPDFALTATLSGRAGGAPPSSGDVPAGSGWAPIVPNWDVGVVFSWPLFDGTVSARADASRAQEQVRREEIAVVKLQQVAAIRQAYVNVDVARSVLPGLVRAVEAARANYAQADARFRGGLGTSVELADAEALRTDAEIELAMGQFEIARTRAAFGRVIAEGL